MTEKDRIKEAYRKFQFETQGIDIWEEGAFIEGWLACKEFFKIKQ